MDPHRRGRHSKRLFILILFAIAYSGLLSCQCASTGTTALDGAIGVVLGLYVCSHPAANAVDSLLFERHARRTSSMQADALWLALNFFALLTGWFAIFIGATRFTAGTT